MKTQAYPIDYSLASVLQDAWEDCHDDPSELTELHNGELALSEEKELCA